MLEKSNLESVKSDRGDILVSSLSLKEQIVALTLKNCFKTDDFFGLA